MAGRAEGDGALVCSCLGSVAGVGEEKEESECDVGKPKWLGRVADIDHVRPRVRSVMSI